MPGKRKKNLKTQMSLKQKLIMHKEYQYNNVIYRIKNYFQHLAKAFIKHSTEQKHTAFFSLSLKSHEQSFHLLKNKWPVYFYITGNNSITDGTKMHFSMFHY